MGIGCDLGVVHSPDEVRDRVVDWHSAVGAAMATSTTVDQIAPLQSMAV